MFKKMCILYIDGIPVSRHVIKGIKYGEKGFYRATTSIEAFREREAEVFYNHYISKKTLHKRTHVHDYDDYIRDMEFRNDSLKELDIDDFVDEIEQTPIFEHEDVKDFYNAIGYDIKKKKYID